MSKIETEEILSKVVHRYIRNNPMTPPKFVVTEKNYFSRNKEFRYELFPERLLEKIPDQSYVIFRSILKRRISQKQSSFYVNPLGPTTILLNGEIIYQGSLKKSSDHPFHTSKFSAETTRKDNELIVICKKVNSGIGAEFGSGNIKGDPFFVMKEENSEWEGWRYAYSDEFPMNFSGIKWLDLKESIEPYFNRKNVRRGESIFAITQMKVGNKGIHYFENVKENVVYLDGQKLSDKKIVIVEGVHKILIEMKSNIEDLEHFQIQNEHQETVLLESLFGLNDSFAFKGPFDWELSEHDIQDLFKMEQLVGNSYWRTKNGGYIRPYIDSDLFGQWNYPLGVTLKGLYDYGEHFNNSLVKKYVSAHLELCTKYYQCSLWEKNFFNAPLMNGSLINIDSLDDCGSMGYTLLEISKKERLCYSDLIIEKIKKYIMNEQMRRKNGALYRCNSNNGVVEKTLWADDTYMSLPFLIAYATEKKDTLLLSEIVNQFKQFYRYLNIENGELIAHIYDFDLEINSGVCWGRGNGWYIFSLSIALEKSADTYIFSDLYKIYDALYRGVVKNQGQDRLWHQVFNDEESYAETSVSSMMLNILMKDQKHNWSKPGLECTVIEESWQQLISKMVDNDGNLNGVCRGSGYSFDREYYAERLLPRKNDTHGIGLILTTGIAYLKFEDEIRNRFEISKDKE